MIALTSRIIVLLFFLNYRSALETKTMKTAIGQTKKKITRSSGIPIPNTGSSK